MNPLRILVNGARGRMGQAIIGCAAGDPAVTMLGLQTRPEAVAALRHELGLDRPNHLFLPALTIALSIVPFLVRSLRASILKTMAADYVRTARDYPLVQSTTLVFAFLVIAINLLTDVIYTFLDPRVRL